MAGCKCQYSALPLDPSLTLSTSPEMSSQQVIESQALKYPQSSTWIKTTSQDNILIAVLGKSELKD
jgi:hypothetical protein